MRGIRAIYEYAATAIGARSSGASLPVRKIAVGPSAPPMMPIDAACSGVNPTTRARRNAT